MPLQPHLHNQKCQAKLYFVLSRSELPIYGYFEEQLLCNVTSTWTNVDQHPAIPLAKYYYLVIIFIYIATPLVSATPPQAQEFPWPSTIIDSFDSFVMQLRLIVNNT